MQRSLLSVATAGCVAASLSAQCVAPSGIQTIETLFAGTHAYGAATPPNYGVSLDPGPALRFDLTVDSPISISSIGVNLLNNGIVNGGVPFPNLIGAPNGTLEFWLIPNATVTNAALFTGNAYTHVPPVPPNAPWTRLNPTNNGNFVFAAPDTPSMATFTPPLALAPGAYAVVLVMVPSGTNPATDRIHPLFTNVNIVPTPLVVDDGFVKFEHGGIQSPAFSNGALQYNSSPNPFIPNIRINYTLGPNVAYQTKYGAGCYDRKQTFYESFAAPGTPTPGSPSDLASGGIGGLMLSNLGDHYLVQTTGATYPLGGITPGTTTHYGTVPLSLTPTHVNATTPATTIWGDWDDATSAVYTMPFTFPYPGGGAGTNQLTIGSNGAIWLGGTQPTTPRFLNDYAGWLLGPPSFAVSYCDLWPATLVPVTIGVGDIFCDSDGASYVTVSWVGVDEYPNAANFGQNNTFQIRLRNTGNVDIAYGNQAFSNSECLVGFTPGNGAPDPGYGSTPRRFPDLSVAAAGPGFLSGNGAKPASIRLALRPKVGNNVILVVDNVDPTTAGNITLVSTGSLPGIDLGFLGMPGCGAWVVAGGGGLLTNFSLGTGPFSWNVGTVLPAFAGISLYAQAVQLTVATPAWNALNWLSSDAVCFQMNVN